jgi:hypothetical protein
LALCPLGSAAQLVALRAVDGRGRPFDLVELRGRIVALTFASRATRDEATRVNLALADRAGADELEVVSVIDLSGVPSFARGYAHRKIAEADRAGRVRHLVDDDGLLRARFAVHPERYVDILIIDRAGALRGRYAGQGQLGGAIELIDALRAQHAATEPRYGLATARWPADTTRLRP